MGLFSQLRAAKADDRELGNGLWRRDHDRFRRAVDRFHQVLEGVEEDQLYAILVPCADELGALIPRVREICVSCQRQAPVDGNDVPGGFEPVHRALSRAANDAATAAQAAAMARYSAGNSTVAEAVTHRVGQVVARIEDAETAAS